MVSRRNDDAFTLVEVLVAIAIIGALIALVLPALEYAREAGRRAACANNLRQLAIGVRSHDEVHGYLPAGGWSGEWVGDPDAGFSDRQPGGWIYNILPYIEEGSLRELGTGKTGADRDKAIGRLLGTPIAVFYCPARRSVKAYPYTGSRVLRNCVPPSKVAKTDYAISRNLSFARSEVLMTEVLLGQGASKTVLVAEKALDFSTATAGTSTGDSLPMYVGDCTDISRASPNIDAQRGSIDGFGGFGSSHPAGVNVAFCDGSVRFFAKEE